MPSPPKGTVAFLFFTDRSAAQSELGETAFRAAWEEGRAMTEELAIALALENEENDANLTESEPK